MPGQLAKPFFKEHNASASVEAAGFEEGAALGAIDIEGNEDDTGTEDGRGEGSSVGESDEAAGFGEGTGVGREKGEVDDTGLVGPAEDGEIVGSRFGAIDGLPEDEGVAGVGTTVGAYVEG